MPTRSLFPTVVYTAALQRGRWQPFNARLRAECVQLRTDDPGGRHWSKTNYPGGYTSYSSAHRMHERSPTFADLRQKLDRHVLIYVASLGLDLRSRSLVMTDCWVNIMPFRVGHSSHLHPLSTISGTYYVQTPPGCAGLKFEDPRLAHFMTAPPPRAASRRGSRGWANIPAQAGKLVLFESWLRHEVPPNPAKADRISISFNYHWN